MLMEHRTEDSHGSTVVKKSRSLDLQSLYVQKPQVDADKRTGLKRKRGPEYGSVAKKKSKKEVLLNSLSSSGRKSTKSLGELGGGGLASGTSGSCKLEPESSPKWSSNSVLGGISLSLNDNIVRVPKRRRDLVRRKKVDVNLELKQEESSSGKSRIDLEAKSSESAGEPIASAVKSVEGAVNSLESAAELNGNSDFDGNQGAKAESNCDVHTNVKQRQCFNGHEENRAKGLFVLQDLKKEGAFSSVYNSDFPSKKARRCKKKGTEHHGSVKDAKPAFDDAVRNGVDSQEEDEENLEANAARMLSSRFDPSCTGFCSSSKSSNSASANGWPFLVSSSNDFICPLSNSQSVLDAGSGDAAAARVLRPRDQHNRKGHFRKRRHFYEVLFGDFNAFWALNRRIKVFWPLDQNWYFGHVIGYDPDRKLHHIKYDDREEEWIDLQHERFKLLLFPSEVPSNVRIKNGTKGDKGATKGKCVGAVEGDDHVNTFMDSEPISSWLARSTRRGKSTPADTAKKLKTSRQCTTSQPSVSDGKDGITRCLSASSLDCNGYKLVSSYASPGVLCHTSIDRASLIEKSSCPDEKKSPIVYFRRRFRRKEEGDTEASEGKSAQFCNDSLERRAVPCSVGSLEILADGAQSSVLDDSSLLWLGNEGLSQSTHGTVLLRLFLSASYKKLFLSELPFIPWYSFGMENSRLFHAILMFHHGSLVAVWPNVHLEMIFVDNIAGLRFILFEGCLRRALACIFLILSVFHQHSDPWQHGYQQLPATSIRFKFSLLLDSKKGIVSEFYYFIEVGNTKWLNLDCKLKSYCLLFKQLVPSECTYDNIKGLLSCCGVWPHTSWGTFSETDVGEIFSQRRRRISDGQSGRSVGMMLHAFTSKNDEKTSTGYEKTSRLPPFALLFSAAPTFFLNLHLGLLMERTIPCVHFEGEGSSCLTQHLKTAGSLNLGCSPVLANSSTSCSLGSNLGAFSRDSSESEQVSLSCSISDIENDDISTGQDGDEVIAQLLNHRSHYEESLIVNVIQEEMAEASETDVQQSILQQTSDSNHPSLSAKGKTGSCPINGTTVEILPFDPPETTVGCSRLNGQHSSELAWNVTDGVTFSPEANGSITWHGDGIASSGSFFMGSMLDVLPDSKAGFIHNGFGNGPKKPRTHVSYSLPSGNYDTSPTNSAQHSKGFSLKRIRRASEKLTSDATKSCETDMLSCDANLLVTAPDRGWRECGARVVLELADHNEWRLVVKISGAAKYSYKAHHFIQPGSVNRYTHAMMWKGRKEWALEFPERTQWTLFKEMHEECYNRNMRAALVKNIPIPGVRLIERGEENGVEIPFVRAALKYFQQVETDVDMAMNLSHVLYDMDSDDERWISDARSSDLILSHVSDEMFEKVMDMLEKVAYAQQRELFSLEELEELLVGVGPSEVIKIIYEHWREKRRKKGLPLIRHFQPPLWEKYQREMKEWELAMIKSNASLSSGCHEKATPIEKPTMFAFCLKPRGLEVPNKGSKQRSQKKLSISVPNSYIPEDLDHLYSYGRRLNGYSFGDEKFVYASRNYGSSVSSPVLHASTRMYSPRDAGAMGYLLLNGDVSEKTYYPKHYRNKSKKMGSFFSANTPPVSPLYNQRIMNKRNGVYGWNVNIPDWHSPMPYQLEGPQLPYIEQLDDSDIDEFRLRDAASAAQHAINMAKLKREKAQRLLYRADLAIHKAVVALMTAEAIKAASEEPNNDV
ncbi:hypothetical protein Dimus_010375 [Dionaea muscipula]